MFSPAVRLFHWHCTSDLRVSLLVKPLTLEAWRSIFRLLRDTVVRSFVKCGIALPTSKQRDNELNQCWWPRELYNRPLERQGADYDFMNMISDYDFHDFMTMI